MDIPQYIPTLNTGQAQATQAQKPPRPPILRYYFRALWVLIAVMLYVIIVVYQLSVCLHTFDYLNASGGYSQPNSTAYCFIESPQTVSFSAFAYAANPVNWGAALTGYLRAEYCHAGLPPTAGDINMTFPNMSFPRYPPPENVTFPT